MECCRFFDDDLPVDRNCNIAQSTARRELCPDWSISKKASIAANVCKPQSDKLCHQATVRCDFVSFTWFYKPDSCLESGTILYSNGRVFLLRLARFALDVLSAACGVIATGKALQIVRKLCCLARMPDAGTLRDWTQIEGDHFDIIRTFSPIQPIVFFVWLLRRFSSCGRATNYT